MVMAPGSPIDRLLAGVASGAAGALPAGRCVPAQHFCAVYTFVYMLMPSPCHVPRITYIFCVTNGSVVYDYDERRRRSARVFGVENFSENECGERSPACVALLLVWGHNVITGSRHIYTSDILA